MIAPLSSIGLSMTVTKLDEYPFRDGISHHQRLRPIHFRVCDDGIDDAVKVLVFDRIEVNQDQMADAFARQSSATSDPVPDTTGHTGERSFE